MLTGLEYKYPGNIWFLALAAAGAVVFALAVRKKWRIVERLRLPGKPRLTGLRTALVFLGMCLMVFALMGPQVFVGYQETEKTGMDIYVLMDTSKSMLTADVAPDRLSVAKKIVRDLLGSLESDRIGFIPFASDAYIQMPLTDDYTLAGMFLDVMDTDMISGGGTNIAAALRLAEGSFDRASGSDRVILIISDGEEQDGGALDALKAIKDDSLRVYTIGVGTEKGGLVPVYNDAGAVIDYMKDSTGNPVTSRLHADTLRQLAWDGNGEYYQAGIQGIDMPALIAELEKLERDVHARESLRRFTQLFQYFLGAGLTLFAAAWLMPEGRASR